MYKSPSTMAYHQRGIGLVEVLVALLLLAVAALGYAALQTRSLRSTDEALTRTQALTILNSAAERIRTNGLQNNYNITVTTPAKDNTPATSTTTSHQIIEYYAQLLNATTKPACTASDSTCGETEKPKIIAARDVFELRTMAEASEIKLGAVMCPSTSGKAETNCLVAAWGNTQPTIGSGDTDCLTSTGSYNFTAECVYIESY